MASYIDSKGEVQETQKKNSYVRKPEFYESYLDEKGKPLPSMTIKNDSYTIAELMEKHKAGMPLPIHQQKGFFDDNPDIEADLTSEKPDLDLTDIGVFKETLSKKYSSAKNLKKEASDNVEDPSVANKDESKKDEPKEKDSGEEK